MKETPTLLGVIVWNILRLILGCSRRGFFLLLLPLLPHLGTELGQGSFQNRVHLLDRGSLVDVPPPHLEDFFQLGRPLPVREYGRPVAGEVEMNEPSVVLRLELVVGFLEGQDLVN